MTDNHKTPEPGGVYRWYAWPGDFPGPEGKVLHVAMPCSIAEGVVRVFTSNPVKKPWTQDYVPADAVLMIPADRGVDVPPGTPRVILRDLPDRLDLSKREHRVVLDNTLNLLLRTGSDHVGDPDLSHAVSRVRVAVSNAQRAADEAARMAVFREKAKELLTGTVDQRLDAIAELMRQAEDGPEDEDYC